MVDTVLYFEGDTHSQFRLVRAIKNRFGAVNEIGVFAMTEKGLKGVSNPSAIFLSQHSEPVPGSCVMVTLEGTRPLLVEIQALVDSGGPSPRRLSVGLDKDRLAMLLAVLHRHAGVACMDQDVFVNAVGGVRISEPAADLAVMLAITSSLRGKALPQRLHRLWRGGAGRRGAPRAARAGAPEGGGQAGLQRGRGAQGQRAQKAHRGPDHPRGGAGGRGHERGARHGLMPPGGAYALPHKRAAVAHKTMGPMNLRNILVPRGVIGLVVVGYASYGWPGVAAVVGGVVMWACCISRGS
jgi:hypothetical protein